MIDASTRGSLYTKTCCYEERGDGIDTINVILSQNASLSHQMVNITKQLNKMKVNVVSSTQPASL